MKKITAVLCIFAMLFALASCKPKELSPEEASASVEAARSQARAEYSQKIEASIKHEEDIYQEKQDTLNSLGKTEKDKRIVFVSDGQYAGMKEAFEIIKFDDNAKFDSWTRYVYYPSTESFERAISDIKSGGNFAYETSDASMRVIVYRYTNEQYLKNEAYDDMLQRVRDFGYTVVE